jgi:hypothetical protein
MWHVVLVCNTTFLQEPVRNIVREKPDYQDCLQVKKGHFIVCPRASELEYKDLPWLLNCASCATPGAKSHGTLGNPSIDKRTAEYRVPIILRKGTITANTQIFLSYGSNYKKGKKLARMRKQIKRSA